MDSRVPPVEVWLGRVELMQVVLLPSHHPRSKPGLRTHSTIFICTIIIISKSYTLPDWFYPINRFGRISLLPPPPKFLNVHRVLHDVSKLSYIPSC